MTITNVRNILFISIGVILSANVSAAKPTGGKVTYATQDALDAESSKRLAVDENLRSAIESETTARGVADTALQGAIDAEGVARSKADSIESSARSAAISGEATARKGADDLEKTTREKAISNEKTAREAADSSESSTRLVADAALAVMVNNEKSARIAADSDLAQQILNIPAPVFYEVGGAGPAGGIVFYTDELGVHGLEAMREKIIPMFSSHYVWGELGVRVAVSSNGIGAGQNNTVAMVISSPVATSDAAKGCASAQANYTKIYAGYERYGDWYLPSGDELEKLRTSDVIDFSSGFYWTSNQASVDTAYAMGGLGNSVNLVERDKNAIGTGTWCIRSF